MDPLWTPPLGVVLGSCRRRKVMIMILYQQALDTPFGGCTWTPITIWYKQALCRRYRHMYHVSAACTSGMRIRLRTDEGRPASNVYCVQYPAFAPRTRGCRVLRIFRTCVICVFLSFGGGIRYNLAGPITGITFPRRLRRLSLGNQFNDTIEGVSWPPRLEVGLLVWSLVRCIVMLLGACSSSIWLHAPAVAKTAHDIVFGLVASTTCTSSFMCWRDFGCKAARCHTQVPHKFETGPWEKNKLHA